MFVPVRSMQLQSVIDEEGVIFVDNQTCAASDGAGGRLIMLSWVFRHDQRRDDPREPAPIELVYCHPAARDLYKRVVGEFGKALESMGQRQRASRCGPSSEKVLPFRAAT